MEWVPPGVVTVTAAGPAKPAGVTAVSCVSETTVKEDACAAPMATERASERFSPVIVTVLPPAKGP